jgi:hypothetical protein
VLKDLEYGDDEKPKYAFCESVHAGPLARWHIRKLSDVGLKLGGGIDTASLCGRVRPMGDMTSGQRGGGGWDLRVRIRPEHFHTDQLVVCEACAAEYLKADPEV